ncbi:MAG: lipopolysaccharide assembly protein LapA domain-containing protein [Acidiferrobacterales bacterium]
MKTRIAVGLGVLFLVILFTLQNTEVVTITFLFWQFSMSRVLLIFVFLAAGVIVGWVLHGIAQRAQR